MCAHLLLGGAARLVERGNACGAQLLCEFDAHVCGVCVCVAGKLNKGHHVRLRDGHALAHVTAITQHSSHVTAVMRNSKGHWKSIYICSYI